jgi:hypothetical protein
MGSTWLLSLKHNNLHSLSSTAGAIKSYKWDGKDVHSVKQKPSARNFLSPKPEVM